MKTFFAIYDDTAREIPMRIFQRRPYTIYRTANMGLVEELSGLGFEPDAMLLEEDIAELKAGNYTNDSLDEEDLKFLIEDIDHWILRE